MFYSALTLPQLLLMMEPHPPASPVPIMRVQIIPTGALRAVPVA